MCECVLCPGTNRFDASMVYENTQNVPKLKINRFCNHQQGHTSAYKLAR